MIEIMGRLPVVENFITILNRGVSCREQVNQKRGIEGGDGIDQRVV